MTDALLAFATSPLILVIVFACCVIDGFLPVLPSETLVIALAALTVAGSGPGLVPLGAVAAAGAFAGDCTAYALGRRLGTPAWLRGRRASAALAGARAQLDRRPASLIIVGRYIPIGRVAVNVTAGVVRFGLGRFAPLDAVACLAWAAFSVALGALAGRWAGERPLLAAALAVAVALILAAGVDGWIRLRAARPRS